MHNDTFKREEVQNTLQSEYVLSKCVNALKLFLVALYQIVMDCECASGWLPHGDIPAESNETCHPLTSCVVNYINLDGFRCDVFQSRGLLVYCKTEQNAWPFQRVSGIVT